MVKDAKDAKDPFPDLPRRGLFRDEQGSGSGLGVKGAGRPVKHVGRPWAAEGISRRTWERRRKKG